MLHQIWEFKRTLRALMDVKWGCEPHYCYITGTKKDVKERPDLSKWWALADLNCGPADYESDALTS